MIEKLKKQFREIEGDFVDNFKYDKVKYGIVIYYFESMLNNNFLITLNYMGKNMSYGDSVTGYNFADNCDEEDIENGDYFENGVMFYLFEYDIIVSYDFFYECLKLACNIYLESNRSDEKEVEKELEIIKNRYNIDK